MDTLFNACQCRQIILCAIQVVPTGYGRGFQSIPRDVELRTTAEGVRLVQKPIAALQQSRGKQVTVAKRQLRKGTTALTNFVPTRNTYELEAEFDTENASTLGFNLLVGEGRKLVVGYNAITKSLFVDRTNTSDFTANETFNTKFPRRVSAPIRAKNNRLKLRVFVDQSSVEVFAGEGEVVLSVQTFPGEGQTGIETFSENGNGILASFKAWQLKSIWNQDAYKENRIPGTLEAEDFNKGGEGGGYHDTDAANRGKAYRAGEGVDVQASGAGGHHVAFMSRGEWLAYTLRVNYSGAYQINVRVAGKGGAFHLELDDKDVTGPITVPDTGGSQAWTFVARRINIPFGQRTLRLRVDKSGFNLDKIVIATAGSDIISGGIYQLTARHSGRVLDSSGTGDGAKIQQWEPLGGDNQKWRIEEVEPGYYQIKAISSGKALEVKDGPNGTPVLQQSPTKSGNQKWAIRDIGGGYYSIAAKGSGKVLDVRENSRQNGGVVQQWDDVGGAPQQWKLERREASKK